MDALGASLFGNSWSFGICPFAASQKSLCALGTGPLVLSLDDRSTFERFSTKGTALLYVLRRVRCWLAPPIRVRHGRRNGVKCPRVKQNRMTVVNISNGAKKVNRSDPTVGGRKLQTG